MGLNAMPKTDREAAAAVAQRLRNHYPGLSQKQAREIVNKQLQKADNKKGG